MTKPFDPTKPVQTRDGHKARIVCTDRKGTVSIVALVERYSHENAVYYGSDGRLVGSKESRLDLVNIPEVTTKIAHVYLDGSRRIWGDYTGYPLRRINDKYIGRLS